MIVNRIKSTSTWSIIICSILLSSCSLLLPKEIRQYEKLDVFSISENKQIIILDGVINSSALKQFKALTTEYSKVKRIEIVDCFGSINDDINLELSKYIYDNKFDIHLLDSGSVASGGTDLFLAGRNRTKGNHTSVGVHSWAGLSKTALDFPVGHKNHLPYINYYHSIGFTQEDAENFYYFTINAAEASSIHWMTDEELIKYKVIKAK